MDITKFELDGIIATSFVDNENNVVNNGTAGSREGDDWDDWMEE